MPDIRVITVAYNPGAELIEMIDSLPRAVGEASFETVVVNNGGSTPALERAKERASVVETNANLGYGKANNLGAKGFDGDWLLIINPDVSLAPGSIARMIEVATLYPRGGAFGPRIMTPEGDAYPSARRFPRLVAGTGHALLTNVWPSNPWTSRYHAAAATDTTHPSDWLSGACLLLRRVAFEAVGGFDDDFFMFFEDTMLGEDLARAGWQRIFVHDAVAVHDQGTSWRERPASMLRAHHDSAYTYLAKVYNKPWQAPLRLAVRAGLKVRLALELKAKA
ncbi:glycosyltransferase [Trueperella pecoris]|uniref:Glycosyltransferase family 2 protein n=1 Tax=Trueperella pecoris TaxID=2733571 RepID=A0A7M1QTM5_9ACTO|nr:glycosyltransferase family 2 protein [Trueperella pecoris]QOQ38298.1 glycosyltransferase family 2 protein [Trueperella pecoris]QOR45216.1 glycosyltransferase family 2 protein [Trueperella pecoris]QTG75120.1 glycosyltransferase family 2 protein [Trueperella pecoris]